MGLNKSRGATSDRATKAEGVKFAPPATMERRSMEDLAKEHLTGRKLAITPASVNLLLLYAGLRAQGVLGDDAPELEIYKDGTVPTGRQWKERAIAELEQITDCFFHVRAGRLVLQRGDLRADVLELLEAHRGKILILALKRDREPGRKHRNFDRFLSRSFEEVAFAKLAGEI